LKSYLGICCCQKIRKIRKIRARLKACGIINVRCLKIELHLYVFNVNMISKYYVILEIQCCQITCLHVFSSVLWCPRKNDVRFVSTPNSPWMVCFKIVSIDSINYPRWLPWLMIWEKFEDTKGVIRSHKSKDRQHNVQNKKDKNDKPRYTKVFSEYVLCFRWFSSVLVLCFPLYDELFWFRYFVFLLYLFIFLYQPSSK
jgi:hypothetical protein